MNTQTSTASRSVVAFFDKREEADRAIQRLVAAGIARTDINIVEGARGGAQSSSATSSSTMSSHDDKGFWESLKDLFLPEEDRYAYAEGLRRGGYVVSVRTSQAHYNQVLDILDAEGTVDIEQRETAWRSEGWAGYQPGKMGAAGSATGAALGVTGSASTSPMGSATRPSMAQGTASAATSATAATTGRDEVIPVAEEQLRVGKREVGHGRVRIRSYTVETPVTEQVGLREEHVTIERRPVDRPLTAADSAALFRDRTIEAEERAEEAVVAKDVRIKEEIAIGKKVEQRTETISDKVRHTEVEVLDERGNKVVQPARKVP
jgi:uncharacterized protein (TIGR02271 family)